MIWLLWVGILVFVIVIFWLSSSSRRRGYHSPRDRVDTKSLLKQNQEEEKHRVREMEKRRGLRGSRQG